MKDSVDWKEKRKRRELRLSASQHDTFQACPRKWWLSRVRCLPEPKRDFLTFGTVLHGVLERFLKADDLGRIECEQCKGQGVIGVFPCHACKGEKLVPVELYPKGWHIAQSRFAGEEGEPDGEVTIEEQDLIKRLVSKAIEEGVIERLPGRRIEGNFQRSVLKQECYYCKGGKTVAAHEPVIGETDIVEGPEITCPVCGGDGKGTHLQITGFIDLAFRDAIHDHKSTKKMAYAKSPNKLKTNTQMLLYAKEIIMQAADRGEPPPQTIELRHNVFSKEGKVRKTIATVTRQEVENHWHRFTQDAIEMSKLRDRVEVNHEISLPENVAAACNSYGGCPFRNICWGSETEEMYERRMKVALSQGEEQAEFKNKMFENAGKGLDASSISVSLEQANNYVPRAQRGITMSMSVRDRLAAKLNTSNIAAGVAPTLQPAVVQPAAAPASVQTSAAVAQPAALPPTTPIQATAAAVGVAPEGCVTPPWAITGCKACGGKGFNNAGSPCRICDSKHTTDGKASKDFVIEPTGNGTVIWVNRADDSQSGESFIGGAAPAPVAVQTREEKPIQAAAPVVAPTPTPAPVVETPAPVVAAVVQTTTPTPTPAPATVAKDVPMAAQAVAETAEEKNKRGRPEKSFTLIRNGNVAKGMGKIGGGKGVIRLDDLLAKYGSELAKESNVESYYSLDAFKRRDVIASVASIIAEDIGTDIVVASGIGTAASDLKNLYEALVPFAGLVIVAEAN